MMDTLLEVMRQPERALQFDLAGWDALIRVCRRAKLLGHLAHALAELGYLDQVPAAPRSHLEAAAVLCARQQLAVGREIAALQQTLAAINVKLVLLKGAAYLAQAHPAAAGRLFSDIDILVPHENLDQVESALRLAGWGPLPLSQYDERYYRQWMHELPPLVHRQRGATLDVHHALLPRTARLTIDSGALLQALQPTPLPGVWALGREDQVLHAACHWFFESEHQNGLRDALDLKRLIEAAATDPDFWPSLEARAAQLGATQVLQAAAHMCQQAVGLDLSRATLGARSRRGLRPWLLQRSTWPDHPLTRDRLQRLAKTLLYLRGHSLRMPPGLLVRHLWHKSLTEIVGTGQGP